MTYAMNNTDSTMSPKEPSRIEVEESQIGTCPSREKPASGLMEETNLTPEEKQAERRFVRKIDLMILPLLSIIYFLASLDRGDISNAAVAGMDTDLNMTAQQLSLCSAFFFIGYIVFQLPGDIFLRILTPSLQLGGAVVGWGAMTAIICVSRTWQTVAGLRVAVGVFEAFLQAAPLYLTIWYKRSEIATRGAVFFSMMSVAGSMNGLISYGVEQNLGGKLGWPAWRWIFFIEGMMSVGTGLVVMVLLPNTPETVKWGFNEEEKEIALRRSREAYNKVHAKIQLRHLWIVAKDVKVWCYAALYGCINISLAGFSQFLPLIVKSLGFKGNEQNKRIDSVAH